MMNSILKKLIAYFAIALLVFTLIISFMFIIIFRNNIITRSRQDLENRAVNIAETLSEYITVNSIGKAKQGGGFGAYLNVLDEIAMSEIWLIDKDLSLITRGNGKNVLDYSELPTDGEHVIREALEGKISFSEGFSGLLGEQTISVGAPVKDGNGQVIAVVLLHAPVEGIDSVVKEGLWILAISIGIALVIAIGTSAILSLRFVKPIKRIDNSAKKLAQGDFLVTTGVKQSDEIGSLAKTIDILAIQLDDASKESERLDKLRRDFIANISHELRTPITVIRGSLEAICDGVVTDTNQQEEYLKQMLNESIYLQRLVNDLLDLTKLQNTDFKMEISLINLYQVTEDAVHSIGNIAMKKNISIKLSSNVTEFSINGDYGRLRQMLMIVIDNAVKFSDVRGSVEVDFYADKENCLISIQDHGIGIAKEDVSHVFERFYKAKSEHNKSGTGLGLAIAKEIADRHQSEISVISEPYKKTIITFLFKASSWANHYPATD